MANAKPPSFPFYQRDWRSDTDLKLCGLAAKGLWMDMLCIMQDADPFGHLASNGQAITDEELALEVGAPLDDVKDCLQRLERRNLFSRRDDGMIYSRRLLRDRERKEAFREYGKQGGNPKIKKEKLAPEPISAASDPPRPAASGNAAGPEAQAKPYPEGQHGAATKPKKNRQRNAKSEDDVFTDESRAIASLWVSLGRNPKDYKAHLPYVHRAINRRIQEMGFDEVRLAVERIHAANEDRRFLVHISNAFGEHHELRGYYSDVWKDSQAGRSSKITEDPAPKREPVDVPPHLERNEMRWEASVEQIEGDIPPEEFRTYFACLRYLGFHRESEVLYLSTDDRLARSWALRGAREKILRAYGLNPYEDADLEVIEESKEAEDV